MARIKVIVTDDAGEAISDHAYEIRTDLTNLTKIEAAIESLRPTLLGDVTQDLLSQEQSAFTKKGATDPTDITGCK